MKRVNNLDKRTGHKLRKLSIEQAQTAEQVFEAMRAESKDVPAGNEDEDRSIPAEIRGPVKLGSFAEYLANAKVEARL